MRAIDDLPGSYHDVIEELTQANRVERDPEREVRLAELRCLAWDEVDTRPGPPWPPREQVRDHFAGVTGLPSIDHDQLTTELLRSAIQHHGGLIVRGLLSERWCRSLNDDIDRTIDAVQARSEGRDDLVSPEWYTLRPGDGPDFQPGSRVWLHRAGTVWTAESPRTLFDLLEALEDCGINDLIEDYLGVHPALSVVKCALRRVQPDIVGGWHQDGYVLGGDTAVVNLWIATSPCGANAPGLDIVPRGDKTLAPTTETPPLDFCITDETIAEIAVDHPVIRPDFAAGDAVIFDQYLLHRTATDETFTDPRYGFECWYFAPSTFPVKWVPVVI